MGLNFLIAGYAYTSGGVAFDTSLPLTMMPPARSVREARGIEVRGDEKFTLQPAKPRSGEWATSVQESLAAKMKQGSGK